MVLYWSDDDAYIAEVPELPGCMADGASYQEALANAEVVIDEWIETAQELGRPIPVPKGDPFSPEMKYEPIPHLTKSEIEHLVQREWPGNGFDRGAFRST